ncbi:MAG: 2-oxo acid dehydrogenase subunit E2 [Deltaproteobacteria bacterium]|nr:2-oxo acid dehydrogenase subunit E2 [Deltaproteobacteria bacterium]
MSEEITMPKLSDTMEEGTLLKWFKKEGDYVQQGEALFEVETDKAVMEVESFVSGILSQILVQEGEKAPVGTPIAIIGEELNKVVPQEEPLVKSVEKSEESKEKTIPEMGTAPKLKVVPSKKEMKVVPTIERVNASPAARSFAQQRGIDITQVEGTGDGGMITLKDVRDFREHKAVKEGTIPLIQRELLPTEKITDLSKMRKAVAATVSYSKQHIPHFYVSYEIDMTKVINQLEELKQKKEGKEKITINDVILRAAAATLKNYPYLNAVYPEQGLILKKEVNIGIVLGLPEGLIIPILKGCDTLTLDEISSGVRNLREKAKSGKFSTDDFTDGTFTISNLGMLGVTDFAAIIYPPQTAILAVSAIKDTPVIKEGSVVPAKLMKVTLSMDHRVVDGINAANFLRDIKKYLETEDLEVMEKPCCIVEDD